LLIEVFGAAVVGTAFFEMNKGTWYGVWFSFIFFVIGMFIFTCIAFFVFHGANPFLAAAVMVILLFAGFMFGWIKGKR
jgi:hypothetical protein